MRWILILAAVVGMGAGPATEPTTVPSDDVATLQQENATLRSEVADLRAEVAALKAKLGLKPAVAAKPVVAGGVKPLKSFDQLLSEIPADVMPPVGRSWDAHFVSRTTEWLQSNELGRAMALHAEYKSNSEQNGATRVVFQPAKISRGKDTLYAYVDFFGIFLAPESDRIFKLKDNQSVLLAGKISQVKFRVLGRTMFLEVELSDCAVK